MNKHSLIASLIAGLALAGLSSGALANNATAAEATAMVKKGVAFIKSSGKDKGYAEISNKAGQRCVGAGRFIATVDHGAPRAE